MSTPETRLRRRHLLGSATAAVMTTCVTDLPRMRMLITNPTRSPGLTRPLPCVRRLAEGGRLSPLSGTTLLDFAGATQVFAFAGLRPVWLAPTIAPVVTTEGVAVVPTHTFESHPALEILFVPGGGAQGVVAAMFDRVFQEFLKKAAGEASWSGWVYTGAFMIAAAGLLDGCRATTYWSQIPNLKLLAERFKIEAVEGYPRYVLDHKKKRFTGGGVSSSVDLRWR